MYCLNTIDKLNSTYFSDNTFEGLKKSFHRNTNKILNSKYKWNDKAYLIRRYKQKFERKIKRTLTQRNINYNLDDVEIFNEPNVFQQMKGIKINEPNDINGFYQFLITKEIPDGATHLGEAQQPKYKNTDEPIEEYFFKCESEQQIKKDLKKFLRCIKFPSKILIRFKGVVETPLDDDNYGYYDLLVKNGRYTTVSIINNINNINTFVNNKLHEAIETAINNFIETNSKSKLCVIYGLELSVYPLGSVGEYIPEITTKYENMSKKLRVYNCNDGLCFFAAYVYYLMDIGFINIKNPSPLSNLFRSSLKKVFNDYYDENNDFNNYKGINEEDILKFCDKVSIYKWDILG